MLHFTLLTLFILHYVNAQGCDPNPCVNGVCTTETNDRPRSPYKCICDDKWAGIKCNLPQPEVICGNKTINIFIDKRIVTEQGLPGSPELVHFRNAPGCTGVEENGGYNFEVKAPFRDCGMIITHNGGDYTFFQQIVWNRLVESVERPLVLLNFKCTYEDKYTVSFGPITPLTTAVDFETSYGVFKVDMNLYKSPSFEEEDRYETRPVVAVEEDVCVSTELLNVMPKDLVLTNRECWASTQQDGGGDSHHLVHAKCKDDPTTTMLSNGEGDLARFCFQMFKWKDTMEEVYMHCIVNVCNSTAHQDYCICQNDERRKRSILPIKDGTRITYGPVYVRDQGWDENVLNDDVIYGEEFYLNPENGKNKTNGQDSKTTILIAVGVVLVIALILLGLVVAVYINCRRRSRDTKTDLRHEGDHVVIPNPSNNHEAMMN